MSGSSPLARGLRAQGHRVAGDDGIIPARAGFTRPCTATPAPCGGSSPLARGLPINEIPHPTGAGIIPARAGFTCPTPLRKGFVWDHPRSRGVYSRPRSESFLYWGSSPLARGLPTRIWMRGLAARIIPARAGFTSPVRASPSICADHPRSRGVYRRCRRPARTPGGSSPLARGLPVTPADHGRAQGIIPARAGFTPLGSHRGR